MTNLIKKAALGALGAVATGLAVAKVRARRKKKAAAAAARKPEVKVAKPAPKADVLPGTSASIATAERVKARKASDAIAQKGRDRKAQPRARKVADPRKTHRMTGQRA